MAQIRKRKLSTLVPCIVLLLILCGCQETRQFEAEQLDYLLLDDETLAYMESLYGLEQEEAMKKLGLSEEDAVVTEYREQNLVDIVWTGPVYINEPTAVPEKEFTKELGSHSRSAPFYSIVYNCDCDNAEETADIAEALYLAAEARYGMGPKHGHFTTLDYLCSEGVFDEIRESGDHETRKDIGGGWSEAWVVGEYSYLTLSVWVTGEYGNWAGRGGRCSIELKYAILPEEGTRFDPKYKPLFYLRPQLQYGTHVDDWPEEYQEKQQALVREKFPGSNPEEE